MMKETPTSGVSARDDSPAIKLFKPVTPRKLGIKCPASLRNRVQSTCLGRGACGVSGTVRDRVRQAARHRRRRVVAPRSCGVHGSTLGERTRRPKLPDPCRGRVFLEELCGRRAGIAARAGRMARQNTHIFPVAGARGPRRAAVYRLSVHI